MATLSINSRELADLQLIIQTYERKIARQSKGEKIAILAYRPMENTEVIFKDTYTTVDPANEVGKTFNNVRRGFSDLETGVNNATTGNVTKAFSDMYKSGRSADRESKFQVGSVNVSTNNTISGMVNAFQQGDVGKGFSVLLNDCIPCDLRFDAIRLTPDISFLEQMISWSTDFISQARQLAVDLVSPSPIQADLCAHLNLLNFTCLPDFNALVLVLQKGITVNLNLPKFKLPGLGDLISMVVVPILAVFANISQAWLNLVVKPIDCLIRSLDSTIRKFKLPPGKNGAAFNINELPEGININATAQLGLSEQQVNDLNNKFVNPTITALERVRLFVIRIRNQVVNAFQKITRKYVSAMNQSTRSVFSLMSGVQEVLKVVSMLKIVLLLQSLFEIKLNTCNDREEALKRTYDDAVKRVNDMLPGKTKMETGDDPSKIRVSRSINVTPDEAEALGFRPATNDQGTVSLTPNGEVPSDETSKQHQSTVNVKVTTNIPIQDCSIISNREQFISVDSLIKTF